MALTDLTRISTSGIATGTTIDSPILRKDVDFRGDKVGVTSALFDSSERRLDFKDNVKLRFGDSADLNLFHNASDSVISHSGAATGSLKILSGGAQSIECVKAGEVKIAHNGSTKIETTSTGAVVTGILTATSFSGGVVGGGGINAGVVTCTGLDLNGNGDVSGNFVIGGDLTVNGTTTTLDTNLTEVDRIEVGANSNTLAGIAVTQSGSADIINLYDGSTKKLVVDDQGNVGIQTLAPAHNLDVYLTGRFNQLGAGGHGVLVGGGTYTGGFTYMSSGDMEISCAMTNKDIVFSDAVGGNQRMRLTGDTGRLGIGISDPSQKLDVSGAVQASGGFRTAGHPIATYASFTSITGGSYATRLGSTGTSTLRHTQIYGGGSHIATFDGVNTRLGIGTDIPDSKLNLVGSGSDANTRISIKDGVGISNVVGRYGNLVFQTDVDDAVSGSVMTFEIDGNEAFRVNASRKIVIGNSGTAYGSGAVQSFIAHTANAASSGFNSIDTTSVATGVGGEISFYGKFNTGAQDYAYLGHIRGIKENATSGNTACALTFHTRPTATTPQERLRIASNGQITTRGATGTSFNNAGTSDFGSFLTVNGGHTANQWGILSLEGNTSASGYAVGAIQFINQNNANGSSGLNNQSRLLAKIDVSSVTSDNNAGDDSGGNLQFFTKPEAGQPAPRLIITSGGDIGVGVDAPVSRLQINSTRNAEADRHTAANYHLALRNPEDDTGESIGLSFGITSNTTKVGAAILHERDGGGSQGSLQFYTSGDGNSLSERLRITSVGLVGINTNSPSSAWLDIATTVGIYDHIRLRRISSDSNVASNWSLKPYGGDLYFREGGSTDKIVFTDSGRVGVNESSPDYMFHIKGTSDDNNPILAVESDSWVSGRSAALRLAYTAGDAREIRGHYENGLQFILNNGEAMRIEPDGRVGINTGSFDYAGAQLKIDGRDFGTSHWPAVQIKGVGSGGVHAAVDLVATSANNVDGSGNPSQYRGLGVLMYDEPSTIEWFAGRPYAGSDQYIIGRKSGGYRAQSAEKVNSIFRLYSGGRLALGDDNGTAAAGLFQVIHDGAGNQNGDTLCHFETNANDWIFNLENDEGAGTAHFVYFKKDGNNPGYITATNTTTTYSTQGSDRDLKKNFESWTEDTLSLFKNINPQKFHFKLEDDSAEKTKGFIAQDMVDKFPEAYNKDEKLDNKYYFNPSGMTVYLMKALQEEITKREEIEAKYNALEARISALESS